MRNKYLLFISYPVYGVLLQQPVGAKTVYIYIYDLYFFLEDLEKMKFYINTSIANLRSKL